jgi:hypothetical protein
MDRSDFPPPPMKASFNAVLAKLRGLKVVATVLLLAELTSGQQPRWEWKEYVYDSHNFAVTVPSVPARRPDPEIPGATNYDVALEEGALRIDVIPHHLDCADVLARFKQLALSGGAIRMSLREFSVAGHAALEYRINRPNRRTEYDRIICTNDITYGIYAHWPTNQPQPPSVDRVLSSFRLLKP